MQHDELIEMVERFVREAEKLGCRAIVVGATSEDRGKPILHVGAEGHPLELRGLAHCALDSMIRLGDRTCLQTHSAAFTPGGLRHVEESTDPATPSRSRDPLTQTD